MHNCSQCGASDSNVVTQRFSTWTISPPCCRYRRVLYGGKKYKGGQNAKWSFDSYIIHTQLLWFLL